MKRLLFLWYVTTAIILSFLGTIIFWRVYPYKTLEVKGTELITHEVKQGAVLKYYIDYCKYTDKNATLTKTFRDSLVFRMAETNSNIPCGCKKALVGVEVPIGLPEGEYSLEGLVVYKVNPIREIEIKYTTDKFMVLSK